MCAMMSTPAATAMTYWILDRLLGLEPAPSWDDHFRGFWDQVQEQRRISALALGRDGDAGSPPALPLSAYEGAFTDAVYGETYVEPGSAGLRIRYARLEGELRPWRGDTFRNEWGDPFVRAVLGPSFAWFDRDGAGRVTRIRYTGFPGEVLVAERRAEPLRAACGGR